MTALATLKAAITGPIPAQAGIGLRFPHHAEVLETRPDVAWFEVHTENFMAGGAAIRDLERIRRDYPVSLHCVGLSLGSADGIDARHLERVRDVAMRIEPGLISDHLSWSMQDGTYLGDLLPLPLTAEALDVVSRNVDRVQARLGRRLLVENPSSYLRFAGPQMPEAEFLSALAARTGCGILCDVNNIAVSAANHGWDAIAYLDALPAEAIGEIHLAGHAIKDLGQGRVIRIDDHGAAVDDAVWSLYRQAIRRFGAVPSLIEWDTAIPAFDRLLAEAAKAAKILGDAQNEVRFARAC